MNPQQWEDSSGKGGNSFRSAPPHKCSIIDEEMETSACSDDRLHADSVINMGLLEHLVSLAVVRASQKRTYFTSEQFHEFVNDARINFIPTECSLASNIAHAH